MTPIDLRNKRATIVGVVFIICYAIYIFVAQPIYKKQQMVAQQIQNKILLIQKYQEIVKQKPYYKAKGIENKLTHTTLTQKFLDGTNPSLAAASQQRLVQELARKTGINIVRVKVDKPKYMEKLLSISIQVTTHSNLKNLTRFVHALENNKKFMIIEEIAAQRTNSKHPEELQSKLTIRGFIKIIEEGKAKAI